MAAGTTTPINGLYVMPAITSGRCDMPAGLVLLCATFVAAISVLAAAWVLGDPREQGYLFTGRSPLQPDLRDVLVVEEVSDDVHHTPAAPRSRPA